jgi:hypothetical protein
VRLVHIATPWHHKEGLESGGSGSTLTSRHSGSGLDMITAYRAPDQPSR